MLATILNSHLGYDSEFLNIYVERKKKIETEMMGRYRCGEVCEEGAQGRNDAEGGDGVAWIFDARGI